MKIKPRLVLCSGVNVTQDSPLRRGRKVVELDTLNPHSNTHLRLENVTDAFLQHLPARFVDLLELAAYIYTADCEASRELAWVDDKATEPWSRDFHLVMPVRDLDFWRGEDVQQSLVSALNFLSSDQFEFTFCSLKKDRPLQEYLRIIDIDETPFWKPDRVVMFSGGLDSLAGAVEWAKAGKSLALVSHRPAVQINKRQIELAKRLKEKFDVPVMHVPVWVNKSGFDCESTQRTRTFLFSALGAAVAHVLQAGGVRFYENGVISLNWPLADEALQSRASRVTHPEALKRMQSFHGLVSGNTTFVVDNPYVFKTKTEVVSFIGENGAGDLIPHSCSCTHTMFQPKSQWHCGRCGQCIDRRVSILAAGLEEFDSEDDYVSDVFTGPRPLKPDRPYDHNIAVNYVRFANDLNGMSEQDVAIAYNSELARAAVCFPDTGKAAQDFVEMHKRHASTVCEMLEKQVEAHAQDFMDGSLDKSSLLAMIGRREHLEQPSCSLAAETPSRDENIFRREGHKWVVRFQASAIKYLDHTDGMAYIQHLLDKANTPVPVDRLYRLVHPAKSDDSQFDQTDVGELPDVMDADRLCDDEEHSLAGYEKALVELKEEEERAERRGDAAELAEVRTRKSELLAFISSQFGKRGLRRAKADPFKRQRQAVSRAIKAAQREINAQLPALGQHLSPPRLKTGTECTYMPGTDIRWTTS